MRNGTCIGVFVLLPQNLVLCAKPTDIHHSILCLFFFLPFFQWLFSQGSSSFAKNILFLILVVGFSCYLWSPLFDILIETISRFQLKITSASDVNLIKIKTSESRRVVCTRQWFHLEDRRSIRWSSKFYLYEESNEREKKRQLQNERNRVQKLLRRKEKKDRRKTTSNGPKFIWMHHEPRMWLYLCYQTNTVPVSVRRHFF